MAGERCFFFGCWNKPGHFVFAPNGSWPRDAAGVELYGGAERIHLDGTLAPMREKWTKAVVWKGMGKTQEQRQRLHYDSEEFPQGQFFRHVLDNGFTAIQWWDRNQGDKRGACNSTILLEGERTTEEMLAALRKHFPHVLANLEKAGIELVELEKPNAR